MAPSRNVKSKHALRHAPRVYPAIADVGMVLLDLSLRPIAFDRGAAEMFNEEAKRRGAGPAFTIPREIVDVIRRSRPGDPSAEKMRFLLGTRDYTCRSYLLQPGGGDQQNALIAVHLERDVSVYDAVSEVGSEYRLTDREHEVLKEIAAGLTSKEVAQRMNISPNTVKVFLRMIMMKMGVSTRSGVIAKVLEHTDGRSMSGASSASSPAA
jgi:DNA-binding CsgD family transcriptional regulator